VENKSIILEEWSRLQEIIVIFWWNNCWSLIL